MTTIPESILLQHLAVLGKTGSGKTSTAKLCVEQIVAAGGRVCVLDPIKSDWWGLTSSADGKRPGLPFQILGGPRGHVPLHSSAGKVIGQLVGSGKLPLSIIDMADFEAGGLQRFFIDFAPALMRHAKGVVYLVVEEAHEFAPKERTGVGAENMAIHWAKKLAAAGRSKGIRLIVATQRIQSLHNAVLGSCETVIAHRLTTPADQEPVLKWLKANTDKATLERVAASLSSLKTGQGWLCSGEAGIFEQRQFPHIKTYDNTATPTGEGSEHQVKTAPVDAEQLRAIVGDAVKEAEANDPRLLRKRIADLSAQLDKLAKGVQTAPPDERVIERALARAIGEERQQHLREINERDRIIAGLTGRMGKAEVKAGELAAMLHVNGEAQPKVHAFRESVNVAKTVYQPGKDKPAAPARKSFTDQVKSSVVSDPPLGKCERAILQVLAQHPDGCQSGKLTLLAGYRFSGGFRNSLSALRSAGLITGENSGTMQITAAGEACGPFEPLPTGQALVDYWLNHNSLGKCERAVLAALLDNPGGLTADELCRVTGYEFSGGFRNSLSALRTAGLIVGGNRDRMVPAETLQ